MLVVTLAECNHLSRAVVGGKAQMLGRLLAAGLPAPDGICLTTTFFRAVQNQTPLSGIVAEKLRVLEQNPVLRGKVLEQLRRAVYDIALPEPLGSLLESQLRPMLQHGPVAVRSSAPDEDDTQVSHAGIYHTELGVQDLSALDTAIRKCWASLFTEQAIYYGRGRIATDMALIVQSYIRSEFAGVMFTLEPLKPSAAVLVEFNRGGNESITAGRAAQQSVRLRKDTFDSDLPVPLAQALLRTAEQVERLLKMPADIEWAWTGLALVILQARPITTPVSRSMTHTVWASQEDVDRVYALPLGKCERFFMRQLQKKVWFRQYCQAQGIPTFQIIYLVYDVADVLERRSQLEAVLQMPYVRVNWGGPSVIVEREHLIETLISGWQNNPIGTGSYCAVQLGEVIPAEITGFATRLADGRVLIEAFPNGISRIYSGAVTPSTYVLQPDGELAQSHVQAFRQIAVLNLAQGDWQETPTPAYPLTVLPAHARRIGEIIRALSAKFGEVRLEWYIYRDKVYVKDLSIETAPVEASDDLTILSAGSAVGRVVRIPRLDVFDTLAARHGVSVVSHGDSQDAIHDAEPVVQIRHLAERVGPLIAVADYPSIGLIPLLRYVKGFIFERGTLLCHTAIVLRETRVPGLILGDAAAGLQDGDFISISPAGVTVLARAASEPDSTAPNSP
ncbi:MAG TPA: PEP/pyruvate-binding domain-containing protein [Anaerolineae bacterium]|nr:PEP/pyruvate-binding domain-containing protein [Anaerolineae bacterium]